MPASVLYIVLFTADKQSFTDCAVCSFSSQSNRSISWNKHGPTAGSYSTTKDQRIRFSTNGGFPQ